MPGWSRPRCRPTELGKTCTLIRPPADDQKGSSRTSTGRRSPRCGSRGRRPGRRPQARAGSPVLRRRRTTCRSTRGRSDAIDVLGPHDVQACGTHPRKERPHPVAAHMSDIAVHRRIKDRKRRDVYEDGRARLHSGDDRIECSLVVRDVLQGRSAYTTPSSESAGSSAMSAYAANPSRARRRRSPLSSYDADRRTRPHAAKARAKVPLPAPKSKMVPVAGKAFRTRSARKAL